MVLGVFREKMLAFGGVKDEVGFGIGMVVEMFGLGMSFWTK